MSDRKKIEKLVGMLGSDHAGEVFNAAQMLVKLAKDENKTLVQFLMSPEKEAVAFEFNYSTQGGFGYSRRPFHGGVDEYHADLVAQLNVIRLNHPEVLNFWEKRFIESVGASLEKYKALTGKQVAAALDIITKAKFNGVEI